MTDHHADVIVVGAGPAGAAAAFHLSARGWSVLLLDRRQFPRDKSCGDALTRPAVRRLAEMGVLARLPSARRIHGVRLRMRGKGWRDFRYAGDEADHRYGLVVPRLELDRCCVAAATGAGAQLQQVEVTGLLRDDRGAVRGVVGHGATGPVELSAGVVFAADGATSRLADEAGLTAPKRPQRGIAIRGYYDDVEDLEAMLEVHMPITADNDSVLASYGWVFPTGERSANIGVGVVERGEAASISRLFGSFLARLVEDDARFRAVRATSPWRAAPLRYDFSPERCFTDGLVLVGDAAGMVSPFTGEGISFALESGALAAEAVDQVLAGSSSDLSSYGALLGQRFAGYFETGREGARRFRLAWHLLEDTFDSDRPLYRAARRAMLFPEGLGESYVHELVDDAEPYVKQLRTRLGPDTLAVGEIITTALRREWPFVAHLAGAALDDPHIPLRPAVLLLIASYFSSEAVDDVQRAAAAMELGNLAALCHLSIEDGDVGRSGRDCGASLAVLVGDLLLMRAIETSCGLDAAAGHAIADAVARLCAARLEAARSGGAGSVKGHLASVEATSAQLSALPCRVGAILAGLAEPEVHALERYGSHLGTAWHLADEVLVVSGVTPGYVEVAGVDRGEGLLGLPFHLALEATNDAELAKLGAATELSDEDGRLIRNTILAAGGDLRALRLARQYAADAVRALDVFPSGPVRTALARIAAHASRRAHVTLGIEAQGVPSLGRGGVLETRAHRGCDAAPPPTLPPGDWNKEGRDSNAEPVWMPSRERSATRL